VISKISLIPLLAFCSLPMLAQSNPVPIIYQPLVPASVLPGSSGFTLTVNGWGFASGATVNWNGVPLATKFVSSSQLKASVPDADVANASSAWVTVKNPGVNTYPQVTYFQVRQPSSTVSMSVDNPIPVAQGSVTAGDFNNDGKLDFVVGEQSGGSNRCNCVAMVPGEGNGSFKSPLYSFVDPNQDYLAPTVAADVDNDGILDLLVGNGANGGSVLSGNGDGTFSWAPGDDFSTLDNSFVMTFADFSRNGNLDIFACGVDVGGGTPEMGIFAGQGDGRFTLTQLFDPVDNCGFPAIADFNGDGRLDLAIPGGSSTNPTIDIYFGNGDGTFQSPVSYPIKHLGHNAIVADMNGDGIPDIVTDGVDVLLGKGGGTFTDIAGPKLGSKIATTSLYLALGDFNGDGKLDLVLDSIGGETDNRQYINLLLGKGDGTFQSLISFPAGQTEGYDFGGFSIGDFNNDGKLDAVVSVGSPFRVFVALQQ
jgi:hypothetical protein